MTDHGDNCSDGISSCLLPARSHNHAASQVPDHDDDDHDDDDDDDHNDGDDIDHDDDDHDDYDHDDDDDDDNRTAP